MITRTLSLKPIRKFTQLSVVILGFAISLFVVFGWQIVGYSTSTSSIGADVAIILGAGVIDGEPSPVFEQRIAHGIHLYRSGQVEKLIFTGGVGKDDLLAESEIGRKMALASGVPSADIFIETESRITQQNLLEACSLMKTNNLETAVLVSDPLHMKRAMTMADHIGLNAQPSPTKTSVYKTWRSKLPSLAWETFFLTWHNLRFIHPTCP